MKFFVTTAIDYVNSRPHLGTAYEKVTADVIARYKRLAGSDVRFLMGNDEHSQNVYKRAIERGQAPLEYCDEMERVFTAVWQRLDVSYDDFIRTTDARRHRPAVQRMAQACYDAGDVYEGVYDGWYCTGCEGFKQEKDLINGFCLFHPTTKAEWIREKNWFFRLSKYQQRLLDHYAAHPSFIEPDMRRNEILRLVEAGLEDISVSRAGQAWGIPLPFDTGSVAYVWFDALINYAAAVGYGWDDELCRTWWPADLHVIGKDITRFHCVIWPAMLMSANLPLPRQVFGHGWISVGGQRMSKSLGNVVDPIEVVDEFGADPLRLYLAKEVPYGGDGDFTWERLGEKYNADLANNLGNLVSRVATMTARYRAGRLPSDLGSDRLAAVAATALADYRAAMDRLAIHEGAAAAFALVSAANLFIADTQPWALAKQDPDGARLTRVLAEAVEVVRVAAVLLQPFMPASSREILRRLGSEPADGQLRIRDAAWRTSGDKRVANEGPLWPRRDSGTSGGAFAPALAHTGGAVAPPSGATTVNDSVDNTPEPSLLSIDDFMKVELRVAKILEAERVPKSKKLVRMTVDVGTERRTIVAGIAEAYEAEALVGRSVVIVANLKPAKLMGIESNGMVLAASPEGGLPIVLNAEPAVPGTRVR
jgi:methionyl-tRNA synthetase